MDYKIYNFFNTDLYKNDLLNSTVYHEYPIYFDVSINQIDKTIDDNSNVIVDGIIDLLCINDNNHFIIDFKSDVVNNEEELIERYKQQLNIYEIGIKQIYHGNIEKYIYSFYLEKFIKINE